MSEERRQEAWAYFFEQNPRVLACWGHQSGRWPWYYQIPDWYDANPDIAPPPESDGEPVLVDALKGGAQ